MIAISKLCKKDCYNFFSPYSLGDTLMLCSLKDAWEKKNKGKIHFIIKPSHEIVMKMYGIKDYSLVDIVYNFSNMDHRNAFLKMGADVPYPTKGKVWIAHPHFHSWCAGLLDQYDKPNSIKPFENFYRAFLGLSLATPLKMPNKKLAVSDDLKNRLQKYGKLEDIIIFLPEANSLPMLNKAFWENLAKEKSKEGVVIQYVSNQKNKIDGVPFVDMTIEDTIALSSVCKAVFSLRSGICDLMAPYKNNLNVFYPDTFKETMTRYSLSRMFSRSIKESLVPVVYTETKKLKLFNITLHKEVKTRDFAKYYLFGKILYKQKNRNKPKKKKPLVTIVTVTYNLVKNNRRDFIAQCVNSVYAQSYENIEHIIIDGGSRDGTLDIFKDYPWLNVYSEPDKGFYDAMNKGIKKANGKYICFMNSDDFFNNPKAVELSVKALEKSKADFSFANALYIDESGRFLWNYNHHIERVFFEMPFCHQTMFTRVDVLKKEGMFNLKYKSAADYDLIIRLMLKKYKYVQLNANIVSFRTGGESTVNKAYSDNEAIKILQNLYSPYIGGDRELYKSMFINKFVPVKLLLKLKVCKPRFYLAEIKCFLRKIRKVVDALLKKILEVSHKKYNNIDERYIKLLGLKLLKITKQNGVTKIYILGICVIRNEIKID